MHKGKSTKKSTSFLPRSMANKSTSLTPLEVSSEETLASTIPIARVHSAQDAQKLIEKLMKKPILTTEQLPNLASSTLLTKESTEKVEIVAGSGRKSCLNASIVEKIVESAISSISQTGCKDRFYPGHSILKIPLKVGNGEKCDLFSEFPTFIDRTQRQVEAINKYRDLHDDSVYDVLEKIYLRREHSKHAILNKATTSDTDDDIFENVGTDYNVTKSMEKEERKTRYFSDSTTNNEPSVSSEIDRFMEKITPKVAEENARKEKREKIIADIHNQEIHDSTYMDDEDYGRHGDVSTVAFDPSIDENSYDEEKDSEFTESLAKQRNDFKSNEEWTAYVESQKMIRLAGSMEINLDNYKVYTEKDENKKKAMKFGQDFVEIDNIMKRKYGESLKSTKKTKK